MLNRMILQGRLVRDIELKDVGGFPMTEFTVAWSEKYKEVEKKCFLRCKAWRNTAETLSNHVRKGQEIIIEGRMVTEEWEKDGQKQSRTICNVEKIDFCGNKSANNPPQSPDNSFITVPDTDEDELPFS